MGASKSNSKRTRLDWRSAWRVAKVVLRFTYVFTIGCLFGWWGDRPRKVNSDPTLEGQVEAWSQVASAIFWPGLAVWLAMGVPAIPSVPDGSDLQSLLIIPASIVVALVNFAAEATHLAAAPLAVKVAVALFACFVVMRRVLAAHGHTWPLSSMRRASALWLDIHHWLNLPLVLAVAMPVWWATGDRGETVAGRAAPVVGLLTVAALVAMCELSWRRRSYRWRPDVRASLDVSEQVMASVTLLPRKGGRRFLRRKRVGGFTIARPPAEVVKRLDGIRDRVATHLSDYEPVVHRNPRGTCTSIDFVEVTERELSRRVHMADSGGLVEWVDLNEDGSVTATLVDGIRDSSVDDVAHYLNGLGHGVLTDFSRLERRAVAKRLDDATLEIRGMLAHALRVPEGHEHKVEVIVHEVNDPDTGRPRLDEIVVLRHTLGRLSPTERLYAWQDFILSLRDGSEGWTVDDRPRTETSPARVIMKWGRKVDTLAKSFSIAEFATRFRDCEAAPEESWKTFPVAIREDGQVVDYNLFHTLVIGQTGAGKGSVLWSIISGLLPAMRAGLVEIYAIDPKNAEAPAAPNLFREIAVEPDQWAPMLERIERDLKARQAKRALTGARSSRVSKKDPLRLLFIDEMSALTALDSDRTRRAEVMEKLMVVLSQGRADNCVVLAAGQAPQKDLVGQTRGFFGMRMALRTETDWETDAVLGKGSTEAGAAAHLIPPANPGNGYATAGIGFMNVEGYGVLRVRFPYTSDEQLAEWNAEFAPSASSVETGAPAVVELEEFTFTLDDVETEEVTLEDFDFTPPSATEPLDDPFAEPVAPVVDLGANPLNDETPRPVTVPGPNPFL